MAEYHFSDAGRELKPVIEALGGWGVRWAFDDPKPEELDAGLLVWKIHQRIDRERLPDKRTVIEFDFKGRGGRRVWLVLEPREVSVCVTPPRFDADLIVRAELALFYRVWLGRLDYAAATRCGDVVVEGPPILARQLPRWFMWSALRATRAARLALRHHAVDQFLARNVQRSIGPFLDVPETNASEFGQQKLFARDSHALGCGLQLQPHDLPAEPR